MSIKQWVLLTTSLALLTTTIPPSNAMGNTIGCTAGPGDMSCTFICPSFDVRLFVSVTGALGGATITGSCGWGTASCTTNGDAFCSSSAATSGSRGVCTLDDHGDPPSGQAVGTCFYYTPWFGEDPDPNPIDICLHFSPHSHTYGAGGSAGGRSDTVFGPESGEVGAGLVTVFETNHVDCNQDGIPGDYDGDWETGVGGGFFGYGPWAAEPVCDYGLEVHGGTVVVNDVVFGSDIAFVVGADDTSGPAISTDPVTGETTCETSGSITPGDPATDPTADPDDCLSEVYTGSGVTCGAGGDGGYWVFLSGLLVSEGAGGAGVNNAPTAGTITA